MAYVAAGVGVQGRNGTTPEVAPEHGVVLAPFYIDVDEVTYAQYERYREATRDAKRRVAEPARMAGDPREPVTGVTWAEARAYALWTGRELPTEAQWERAARGADGFDFPWGHGPAVWPQWRVPGQLDPVGLFRGDESPFGVRDMAGNAREWCHDWYRDNYYAQLIAKESTPQNPTGPATSGGGELRVVKGGDPNWYVWARTGVAQSQRPPDVGFRCALRLGGQGGAGAEERGRKPPARNR
ncbi:MAG: formylglycine-generating enzyme family protein [Planctomycetaceae bacterium]